MLGRQIKINKKTAKLEPISIISSQPVEIWPNGDYHWIQRVKYVYLPVTRGSNRCFEVAGQWIKRLSKMAQIRADFNYSATTSEDMAKRGLGLGSAGRIGVYTTRKGVPTAREGVPGWRY